MRRITRFLLIIACVFLAAAAFGAGTKEAAKQVELVFWMLGDPPKDLQSVNDELNKLTMKDLNCTVKVNMTGWTDWLNKYTLLLASGQPIDLIFTAEWVNYNQFALKGAYKPLDSLVPAAAPALWKFVPKEMWEAVKVNGKIYTVPATWKEYVEEGIAYREDIRKKYSLPVPDSVANIEAYFDGIKKNVPEMTPTIGGGFTGANGNEVDFFTWIYQMKYKWTNKAGLGYGLVSDYATPSKVYSYWGSTEMLEDLKVAKRWADKGFWPRNILSSQDTNGQEMLQSGTTSAALSLNPVKFSQVLFKMKDTHPDWEVKYVPYSSITKLVRPVHPIHNGFAIPISSVNPERALAFYEKMVTDKTYNWLTEYGIGGKHFTVDEGKYYKMIGTADTNGFMREAMNGWAWRNPGFQLFDRSFDAVLAIFKEFDTYSKPDIYLSFVEDYTPYQAERAALFQVTAQYLQTLEAGLVADVDKAYKEFLEKADAAGLKKIQASFTEQWLKYCKEKGLK
jgi:putative aldouronate transport system substrate-binding protein